MAESIGVAVALDNEGDIQFRSDRKDFLLIEDTAEVAQALSIRLRTFLGEDRVNPEVGVRWDRIIALFTEELVQGALARALLLEPRVAAVGEIITSLEPTTRVLTVDIPVTLKDGSTITITEAFGV